MPFIFSYGTLQRRDVQLSTFGRLLEGRADQLLEYDQSVIPIRDPAEATALGETHHANVAFTARKHSAVNGTVFEITDSELTAADQYERPAGYDRWEVILGSGKRAWIYTYDGQARQPGHVDSEKSG
jgi:gamma-glutamylcyclotransferase (GGCT)/AIG2-like uncharacterized protein YtfP